MSMNPFCEIAVEEGGAHEGKGRRHRGDRGQRRPGAGVRGRCAPRWPWAPTGDPRADDQDLEPLAVAKVLKA